MRGDDFGFTALKVVGGLLPAEFLAKVAALDASDQDNAAYGLTKSLSLRDEIGRSWRIAGDLWGGLRGQGTHVWLPAFLAQVLTFSDLQLLTSPIVLGERRYALTHCACKGAVAIALIPSSCDLDRSDAAFGEDGRRRSPFWLVQEYLNAAEEAAWGIVANGTLLRVLRDNPSLTRTAYIEIDLERMFEDQIFADFAAFWLLAHASRFQPREPGKPTSCIFERWRDKALETGERFKDLRKGVTEALLTLGQGFLAHPANEDLRAALTSGRLDAAGLHQQLLRLVYRLLFLFTIEDRGMLHPPDATDGVKALYRDGYGAAQLRKRSLRSLAFDKHDDLWQGLGITFLALERGASEIAAPALGGLFDRGQCPDLFAARLANARLLTAMKALAFFRSGKALARVNYRDMNTEEFGSVYESLLELHPFIETQPWRFGYLGINGEVAKSAERKETGSYYTKPILVQELIKSALDPLIRETATAHPYDQRATLLNLKILDPACGSGHFLLAASRRLATEIARLDAAPDPPTEAQHQHALREVVRHCIFGVDKNPLAVELCKTALWIETVEPGKPLSFLDHHIKCGDSVIGVFDLKVLENGIPDDAYKARPDEDKKFASRLKTRNCKEQTMLTLDLAGAGGVATIAGHVAEKARAIEDLPEDEIDGVIVKARRYRRCQLEDPDLQRLRTACDLWTAAFFAHLNEPKSGEPERLPTSDAVFRALAAKPVAPAVAATALDLAYEHRFFHWPLEFPEIFPAGGFDLVLGNPPWDTLSPDTKEFFAPYDPQVRSVSPDEQRAIVDRLLASPSIAKAWERHCDALYRGVHFVKASGRYRLFAPGNLGKGDFNVYRMFAELALTATRRGGRTSQFVPENFYNGANAAAIRSQVFGYTTLEWLLCFENRRRVWFNVHAGQKFAMYSLKQQGCTGEFRASFGITSNGALSDAADNALNIPVAVVREFSPDAVAVMEFSNQFEIDIARKMYARFPKFGEKVAGAPYRHYMAEIHMGNDRGLFDENPSGLPVYEGRMVAAFDYRAKGYVSGRGRKADWVEFPFGDPAKSIQPQWYVPHGKVPGKLGNRPFRYRIAFCDVASPTNERSLIAAMVPSNCVCGHSTPTIIFHGGADYYPFAWLGIANSVCMDLIVRMKAALHVTLSLMESLPFWRSNQRELIVDHIVWRSAVLSCAGPEMADLWAEVRHEPWMPATAKPVEDPDERAHLQAEIDALVAYLYDLTEKELRYILLPADVLGADCGIETFKRLRLNEEKAFKEYRTRRLVLAAFERFATDGTLDSARQAKLKDLEQSFVSMLARAALDDRPTLFVEGEDDAAIITAAWSVLFEGEPLPFKVLPAGGTTQLKGLAAPEKSFRPLLGDCLIVVVCDNDGEGRALWTNGHLHKGGKCKRQTNGVWWCLLPLTDEFRAVMNRFNIDAAFWPFTIEDAFPAALRLEAMAESAYALDAAPMADLLTEPRISKSIVQALASMPADDPAHFYLRRPTPDAKDRFAAWVTAPERLTAANYAAFAPVLTSLKQLLEREAAKTAAP